MHIRDFRIETHDDRWVSSALVSWEDSGRPAERLWFEVSSPITPDEAPADAFLCACFPLAVLHRERRLRVEGGICPMLVEGLHEVHAWWAHWGVAEASMPAIEASGRLGAACTAGPRRAFAFLSGGVDSLHMLHRNHQVHRLGDPAYVADALFIYGFDVGKHRNRLDDRHFALALEHLRSPAEELDVRLILCRTNVRHVQTAPGFWLYRHHGAVLAALGHAATIGPALIFMAATQDLRSIGPWGSHPLIDIRYASQRVTFGHEGLRFSRLTKVRELAGWPAAVQHVRVCSANPDDRLNCGECEKCIRTRLEFLAAGQHDTPILGDSLVHPDQLAANVTIHNGYEASCYEELLTPLDALRLAQHCRIIREKLASYRAAISGAQPWRLGWSCP